MSATPLDSDAPVVRVHVTGHDMVIDTPVGWSDPEALRVSLAALRSDLLRALAPSLPPRSSWPASWLEAHAERVAIAAEGGAPDPEAVADADLRVQLWRGEVDIFDGIVGVAP